MNSSNIESATPNLSAGLAEQTESTSAFVNRLPRPTTAKPSPWLRWFLLPLALVPVLVWLENSVDVLLSALFFDVESASFLWRDHWLTSLIHRVGRLPAALIFLWFATASVLQPWQPRAGGSANANSRIARITPAQIACISMLVCIGVVNVIKRSSNTACSWDLIEFGGIYPHLGWFSSLPLAMPAGRCWPGAFSLSGFVLLAAYFYLFDIGRYQRATLVLWLVLLYANALGFVQVMRGAHGLSHQMWTGLFCWYLCLTLYWGHTHLTRQR